MEGVVVNARRDGANFTVSVVTDAQGKYSFPRTHLEPGKYAVTIRAVGYDLTDPGPAQVAAGQDRSRRSQASEDERSRLSTELPRVGDEHPRDDRAEGQAGVSNRQLRLLPYLETRHEVEAHGRRVRLGDDAHADVLHRRDRRQRRRPRTRPETNSRADCGGGEERELGQHHEERSGGVPRDAEPERRQDDVAVRAQDAAAPDGQGDARHHHPVRHAAAGHGVARSRSRFQGNHLVHGREPDVLREDGSEDRQIHGVPAAARARR